MVDLYLKEYIRDFGEVNNLENKVKETSKKYSNPIFISEEIIRRDLEEKGIKNWFAQDLVIFKYIGEVHHFPESPVDFLDEKLHIFYNIAIDMFGDDLNKMLEKEPLELFKEKVGIPDDFEKQVIYHLLINAETF